MSQQPGYNTPDPHRPRSSGSFLPFVVGAVVVVVGLFAFMIFGGDNDNMATGTVGSPTEQTAPRTPASPAPTVPAPSGPTGAPPAGSPPAGAPAQ